jgi:hypothetical protein
MSYNNDIYLLAHSVFHIVQTLRFSLFTGPFLQQIHPKHYIIKLFTTFSNDKIAFAPATAIHTQYFPQHNTSLEDLKMLTLHSGLFRKCEN